MVLGKDMLRARSVCGNKLAGLVLSRFYEFMTNYNNYSERSPPAT